MNNNLKYNCIFGGGGIRGMCYIGAVEALKEFNIEIDSIAGSSVGAVFASLFAAGCSIDEIKELFFEFNMNMFRDININLFSADISISKGEIFYEWVREKIGKKFFGENYSKSDERKVTFKDLKKDLNILTIDINTNTPFIFSKKNTPDVEIAFAVRASASLPGLMKPVNYNHTMLVDGDLIKSWPAWKIYSDFNNSSSRILEFRLEGSKDGTDIKNPVDYINSLINTIWYLSTENVFNTYKNNDKYDYVVIDTKDIIMFDFSIDKSLKENLIEKGYNVTKSFLEKSLCRKKNVILEKYEKLLKKIELLLDSLKHKRPKESMVILNEILADLYEDNEYIDTHLCNQILIIKKLLRENIKYFLFTSKIEDIEEINNKALFVKEVLNEKVTELENYVKNFSNIC